MSYEYTLTPIPGMVSKTDIPSRLDIWLDDDIGSEHSSWNENYGNALFNYACEFADSEHLHLGYWLMEDFEEIVNMDDAPVVSVVELALAMKCWHATLYGGMLCARVEPATLHDFHNVKYFTLDKENKVVLLADDLAVKAYLEEQVDKEKFIKWITENKIR